MDQPKTMRKNRSERVQLQLTHSNKPVNPKRTIVANRPSTEASKPWPRHTVFPARDSRPLAGLGEEVERMGVGMVYGGYVEDIPEVSDEEMPHEHESEGAERDGVPDAHRSRIIG